jgi:hypothetical protein
MRFHRLRKRSPDPCDRHRPFPGSDMRRCAGSDRAGMTSADHSGTAGGTESASRRSALSSAEPVQLRPRDRRSEHSSNNAYYRQVISVVACEWRAKPARDRLLHPHPEILPQRLTSWARIAPEPAVPDRTSSSRDFSRSRPSIHESLLPESSRTRTID